MGSIEASSAGNVAPPSSLIDPCPRPSLVARPVNAKATAFEYQFAPPSASELLTSLSAYDIPSKIYQAPYYSIEGDAPERPREYAGLVFRLKGGTGIAILDEWTSDRAISLASYQAKQLSAKGVYGWEYAGAPPNAAQAKEWLKNNKLSSVRKPKKSSQVGTTSVQQVLLVLTWNLLDHRPNASKPLRSR